MAEEHFAALRPRRSDIITPENSSSPSLSNFHQYNQRDLHTAVVAVKPRGPRKEGEFWERGTQKWKTS